MTDPEEVPPHLIVTMTARGFKHLPPIPSSYGGTVRAYESSNAEGPHVWLTSECPSDLNRPDSPQVETPMHLTVESAQQLVDQLQFLIDNHYQRT